MRASRRRRSGERRVHGHGARLEAVVAGELQQRGMKANGIPLAFEHGALQIVVEQDPRQSVPRLEGADVPAQEVLHAGIEKEAQEDAPTPGQHHDEAHQRSPGAADLDVIEVGPVDLALCAGQGDQAQVGFRRRAGSVVTDEVTKVVGAAAIAAFLGHDVEPAGGKGGKFLQGLPDEGQVEVNGRGTHFAKARQPRLAQDAFDAAVMDVQLPGNGADTPFLDVVVAQDMGFEFRGQGHGMVRSDRFEGDGEPVGAERPCAQIPLAADGRNGSARATAMRLLHARAGSPAVEQPSPVVGNPDASLCCVGHGSDSAARRGHADRAHWLGNADRPCVENGDAPAAHSRPRSNAGRGRRSCRSAPRCGSARRESVVRVVPSVIKCRSELDTVGRLVKYCARNVARPGTGRGIGGNLVVLCRCRACSFSRRPF